MTMHQRLRKSNELETGPSFELMKTDDTDIEGKRKDMIKMTFKAMKEIRQGREPTVEVIVARSENREGNQPAAKTLESADDVTSYRFVADRVRLYATAYMTEVSSNQLQLFNHESVTHPMDAHITIMSALNKDDSFWLILQPGKVGVNRKNNPMHVDAHVKGISSRNDVHFLDSIDQMTSVVADMSHKTNPYTDLTKGDCMASDRRATS